MNQYERGKQEPDFSLVERVAQVLEVPECYFYCGDDRLAEIMLHYAVMSEAQRRELQTKAAELVGQ